MAEATQASSPRTASSALPMRPLPQFLGLSDAQRRGTVCVWCSQPLTAESARDLGERPAPDGTRMWPRGCSPCVQAAARRVFRLHNRHCACCIRNSEDCPDWHALRDLALEGRRREGQL